MLLKSPGLPINKVVSASSCPLPLLPPIIHPCPLSPFCFLFPSPLFLCLNKLKHPIFYTFPAHKNYIHPSAPHPPHFHFFCTMYGCPSIIRASPHCHLTYYSIFQCPSPAPIPPHFRFFEPFMDATLPPRPDQAQGSLITDLEAIDNSQIKKRTDWARFPTLPKKRQRCQPHDICGTYHFK